MRSATPKPSATIDQIPLDWCFQPGVKLDFRHFANGYVATAPMSRHELARIGHTLKPLEIVVVNTSAARTTAQPDYVESGCGMGREATLYLTERGVRVTGIDGWSWDAPFIFTAQALRARTTIRRSSGKATRPAATSAIAISRSCTIWKRCRRTALHLLLPGEGERRLGRLDTGGGDLRKLIGIDGRTDA